MFFTANTIAADKQAPTLLSAIGATTYSILRDLMAPELPGSKSLVQISDVLRKHFELKQSVIAERFHFHKRDQVAGESITDFDAALRKLATYCNFAENLEKTI